MSPTEKYTLLRAAGFTHAEAMEFINKGKIPNQNTQQKREAVATLQKG